MGRIIRDRINRIMLRAQSMWMAHRIFRNNKTTTFAVHGTVAPHLSSIAKMGLKKESAGYTNWIGITKRDVMKELRVNGRSETFRKIVDRLYWNLQHAVIRAPGKGYSHTTISLVVGRGPRAHSRSDWLESGSGISVNDVIGTYALSPEEITRLDKRFPDFPTLLAKHMKSFSRLDPNEKKQYNAYLKAAAQIYAQKIIRSLSPTPKPKK